MNELLRDLPGVIVFLDNILIIGNGSFDNHLEQVETVLKRLLKAGM